MDLTRQVLGDPSRYPRELPSWIARYFSGNKLLQITPVQLKRLFSATGKLSFSAEIDAPTIGVTGTVAAATIAASGAIKSTGPTNGIGYSTGAGGAVVQATNKTTAVTLNNVCGKITMNAAALAAGATARFVLSNSVIAATDVVIVNAQGGNTASAYNVWAENTGAGFVGICVKNISAGSLSEAVVLNFVVIKAVSA